MDVALALLVLWALLFVPVGLLLHWLVLGAGARTRALPLAPITGIAVGFIVLAALRAAGVHPGEPAVMYGIIAVSVACVIGVWRLGAAWRSHELIGMGCLLLLAVTLLQVPVLGAAGEGPLGYGSTSSPVTEVATIEAAAQGSLRTLDSVRDADRDTSKRYTGFEQFAALTVALGQGDSGAQGAKDGASLDALVDQANSQRWSAYTLHAPIGGMLAVLVLLPLYAFARARGVKWFGLVMLVPLGVLAPATFLALASGEGAAASSIPFISAAAFSLLVTRRDRGWWALVALYCGAVLVAVGPAGLLPIACIGGAWQLLRSGAYEHLAQLDRPVNIARSVVVAALGGMLSLYAVGSAVLDGAQLPWTRMHDGVLDAVVSWPFAWLGTNLAPDGPERGLELAIWVLAPALLAVAAIYAVVRNERRELSVLVGAVATVLVACLGVLLDRDGGIALIEYAWLATSPLLAAMVIRAVALARANAEEQRSGVGTHGGRKHRFAGLGPTLLVLGFAALSISATGVTGTRMVHAPALSGVQLERGSTLVAAGDPWLAFIVDGERTRGGYADADELAGPRPLGSRASESITFGVHNVGTASEPVLAGAYRKLVLGSSPLASDPTRAYTESSDLDPYAARLFYDRRSPDPTPSDVRVDQPLNEQRVASATEQRAGSATTATGNTSGAETAGETDASADAADQQAAADPKTEAAGADPKTGAAAAEPKTGAAGADPNPAADAPEGQPSDSARDFPIPLVHTPVEESWTSPATPAGLLVPPTDVPGCSTLQALPAACTPKQPELGDDCTTADRESARSELDLARADTEGQATSSAPTGSTGGDAGASTPSGPSVDAPAGSTVAFRLGTGRAVRHALRGLGDPEEHAVTLREIDSLLPPHPTMLGVACFDVELASKASAIVVHLRDVGLVFGAETAVDSGDVDLNLDPVARTGAQPTPEGSTATNESPWTRERAGGGGGGVNGGYVQHGTKIGSQLVYGRGRIDGSVGYDLVLEGSFGAGVGIGSAAQLDGTIATINGAADGFGPLLREVPLQGGAVVTNAAGTSVELGRLFARPRDLPRSCDVVLPVIAPALRETQLVSRATGDLVTRPGFTVALRELTSKDGVRSARIVVGSYMSRGGLPRYMMVDWTEQFEHAVTVEGCDGTERTEGAAVPGTKPAKGVSAATATVEAFGGPDSEGATG